MSRPAIPVAIHRAQGTYRESRHAGALEAKAKTPKVPTWLDAEGKKLWRYFSVRLADVQVLTELDQQALGIYCAAAARLAKGELAIATMGEVIRTPAGFAAPNPWVGITEKCQQTMLRYGAELGLTPASRAKIRINPTPPASAVASRRRAEPDFDWGGLN